MTQTNWDLGLNPCVSNTTTIANIGNYAGRIELEAWLQVYRPAWRYDFGLECAPKHVDLQVEGLRNGVGEWFNTHRQESYGSDATQLAQDLELECLRK